MLPFLYWMKIYKDTILVMVAMVLIVLSILT